MFKNKSYQLLSLMLLICGTAIGQSTNWFCPPYIYATATNSATILTNAPAVPYRVSNGVFSDRGTLNFYVVNDKVYNVSGTVVGVLPDLATNTNPGTAIANEIEHEVSIVPIPGECAKYYIIYYKANGQNPPVIIGNLAYVIVEAALGVVTVTVPTNNILETNYANDAFLSGIAVSKRVASSSTEKRFLYFVNPYRGISRYDILKTGISNKQTFIDLGSSPGVPITEQFTTSELELSPDQSWLAWGDYSYQNLTARVHIARVNSTGYYVANSYREITLPAGVEKVKGLEFNASSDGLYISAGEGTNGGVYKITNFTAASPNYTFIANTASLNNTQLELALNGDIYGYREVNSITKLTRINNLTGALTDYNVPSKSNLGYNSGSGIASTFYTLPDQIDGESYVYFTGQTAANLTALTLNTITPSTACTTPTSLTRCIGDAITLGSSVTGNTDTDCPTEYKLDIYSINTSCNQVTGTGYINYTSGWGSTLPTGINIRTLVDNAGISLENINLSLSNRFKVVLSARNCCGRVSTLNGLFTLSAAPTSISTDLKINQANGTPVNPVTTLPVSGANVGIYSASYNIANTTGNVTSYRTQIDEVDCTTGALVKSICDITIPTVDVSTLTALALNSINVPAMSGWAGGTGYFAVPANSLNKCFKLTVTVSNQCGSSTKYSYLRFDGYYRPAPSTTTPIADIESKMDHNVNSFNLYPNPLVDNELFLEMMNEEEGNATILVYDITGQCVYNQSQDIAKGLNTCHLMLPELAAGVYFYQVITPSEKHTGKFSKVE